jgi:hypothetical protein
MDIKNILGHESAAHMGLIHEEKQRPKISCYCTLKVRNYALKRQIYRHTGCLLCK